MTTRHAGYLITLADDIREDDAEESILIALRMIKGVISIQPIEGGTMQEMIAKSRIDAEWRVKIIKLLTEKD